MLNRTLTKIPRLACAFALASAVTLLIACGAKDEPADEVVISDEPADEVVISKETLITYGLATPEELVFLSDVVARVRLISAEPGSMLYFG